MQQPRLQHLMISPRAPRARRYRKNDMNSLEFLSLSCSVLTILLGLLFQSMQVCAVRLCVFVRECACVCVCFCVYARAFVCGAHVLRQLCAAVSRVGTRTLSACSPPCAPR
jgi:hypothetical protein